jgi:propionate CoA-transferase
MKLVEHVAQITFSGKRALEQGQTVIYVTERAVFRLTADGVALIEIAPGIDLQGDVLDRMGFVPIVASPRVMSPAHFTI